MKKLIIFGLVLLVLGAAVFGAGWVLTGGDASVLNGEVAGVTVDLDGRRGFVGVRGGKGAGNVPEERSYVFSDVLKIVLDESNTSVRVTKSPDGQVHLRCRENSDYYFDIKNQTGTLTLTRKSKPSLDFNWGVSLGTELQVPDGLDLELETSNSSFTAEDLDARSLRCETSNGSVKLTDCAVERALTVMTGNGSVTLTRCAAGDRVEVDTSNSSITVDDVTAGQRIRLETSNGSVKGTLPGSLSDYTVESHTSNGSNSLPEHAGRGAVELSVKTSNASIRLKFAED